MRCPYLSSASKEKCTKMLDENIDEELSDFDLKHFCHGYPIYCYYFRSLDASVKTQSIDNNHPSGRPSIENLLLVSAPKKIVLLK